MWPGFFFASVTLKKKSAATYRADICGFFVVIKENICLARILLLFDI